MNTVSREETRTRTRSGPRSKKPVQVAVVAILMGAGVVTSLAHIVGVAGDAVLVTPPDVTQDQNESDTAIQSFDEKQCFTLMADLETDQGTIPAGTEVSCHMMRVDPVTDTLLQGVALFDAQILGVISGSEELDDSDSPCGDGVIYPAAGVEDFRGLEQDTQADAYRPVQGGCGLQLRSEVPPDSFQDQVRIITKCCDEKGDDPDCCED